MTTDIEARLRRALEAEAENAPTVSGPFAPEHLHRDASVTPRERRPPMVLASAAAAVVVVALSAWWWTQPDTSGVATSPEPSPETMFVPDGDEVVLAHGESSRDWHRIVKPESLHYFKIEGHPDNYIYETLWFDPLIGRVLTQICSDEVGGGGCTSPGVNQGQEVSWSLSSSVGNGYADTNVLALIGLDPNVAFVNYATVEGVQWQRPVQGAVFFAVDEAEQEPVFSLFDSEGTVIDVPDALVPSIDDEVEVWIDQAGVDRQAIDTLTETTTSVLRSCLDRNGATWTAVNVPSFPTSEQGQQIWDLCSDEATAAVETQRVELGLPPPTR